MKKFDNNNIKTNDSKFVVKFYRTCESSLPRCVRRILQRISGNTSEDFIRLQTDTLSIIKKYEKAPSIRNHITRLTPKSTSPMKLGNFLFKKTEDWQSCKSVLTENEEID